MKNLITDIKKKMVFLDAGNDIQAGELTWKK